jgi:hypothetical protein
MDPLKEKNRAPKEAGKDCSHEVHKKVYQECGYGDVEAHKACMEQGKKEAHDKEQHHDAMKEVPKEMHDADAPKAPAGKDCSHKVHECGYGDVEAHYKKAGQDHKDAKKEANKEQHHDAKKEVPTEMHDADAPNAIGA